jgi:citrate synthase
MTQKAKLAYDDKTYEMPIVEGTYAERGVDIRSLRKDTGLITLDSGYMNTGATTSEITYISGEEGILLYRGYPIEQLAEKSSFVETSYLLIYGELPTSTQLEEFSNLLTYHSMLHEDMRHFFDGFPSNAHPMAILSSMVSALSAYYPDVCFRSSERSPRSAIRRGRVGRSRIRRTASITVGTSFT